MKALELRIYGRSRTKFAALFPEAEFLGYECNIRYCYFLIKTSIQKIKWICDVNNITILDIVEDK